MRNISIIKKQFIIDHISGVSYSIFWISLIILSLGYLSYASRNVPDKLCIVVMALGIIGIGYSLLHLIKLQIRNKYFSFIFSLYMVSQSIMIFQAFSKLNFARLILFISDPYFFFPYLVPLVILIPANIFFIKRTFDYFTLLGILLFVVFLTFMNYILNTNSHFSEHVVWTFGSGCGFLLLTWDYHNNKRKIIAISVVMISLFISTVMARRNIMLTFSNYILFSIFLMLFNSRRSIPNKILILFVVLFSFSAIYYTFNKYQDNLFARIAGRIEDNTREEIFSAFFTSMSSHDLIYGKGFYGTYYAPGIEQGIDDRSIIECGYLQTILKGGIINLTLFLLIAIPAGYLGIAKSKNTIAMASGAIIVLWLIDMFPWGMPALNIRYFLVWICISICYSKEIRNLSESDIKNSLKLFIK